VEDALAIVHKVSCAIVVLRGYALFRKVFMTRLVVIWMRS